MLERWVVIAGNRGRRPSDFIHESLEDSERTCFFCPGNEDSTPPEICRRGGRKNWRMRCFPNKFPAAVPEDGEYTSGLLKSRPAYGSHEVLVETNVHGKSFPDFKIKEMNEYLDVVSERINGLEADSGVEYVSVFKNHGKSSGASLSHSHTQILSTPFTPRLIEEKAAASRRHRKLLGNCGYCDVAERESKTARTIRDGKNMVSFAPYASRYPFEAWIMPKKHVERLEDLNKTQKNEMSSHMISLLKSLKEKLGDPSYNLILYYSPKSLGLHLHWEIIPRLSNWAGFELGTEIIINTMPPEQAASHLSNI